jgi:hypothetical protein
MQAWSRCRTPERPEKIYTNFTQNAKKILLKSHISARKSVVYALFKPDTARFLGFRRNLTLWARNLEIP